MPETNSIQHSDDTTEDYGELPTNRRKADLPLTTDYTQRPDFTVRQLYAIIDSVTNSIVGGIQIHLNNESAIRTLYDIALGDTMVNKHPRDFDLYMLGALGSDHRIQNNLTRIISGAQIEAIVKASAEAKSPSPRRAD